MSKSVSAVVESRKRAQEYLSEEAERVLKRGLILTEGELEL